LPGGALHDGGGNHLTLAGLLPLQEGAKPMPDDEQRTPGVIPVAAQEFIAQLRAMTRWLEGLSAAGARMPSAADIFPLPGALSAAQLSSITDSITAQRRSIGALQAQLSAFDQQLAVLEQILGPLGEWSNTWAEFEQRLLPKRPRPETGDPGPASSLPSHAVRSALKKGRADRPNLGTADWTVMVHGQIINWLWLVSSATCPGCP
jgi:hypothetical protein